MGVVGVVGWWGWVWWVGLGVVGGIPRRYGMITRARDVPRRLGVVGWVWWCGGGSQCSGKTYGWNDNQGTGRPARSFKRVSKRDRDMIG